MGRIRAASGRVSRPAVNSDFCLVEEALRGIPITQKKRRARQPTECPRSSDPPGQHARPLYDVA
jgi:hypothetical protein